MKTLTIAGRTQLGLWTDHHFAGLRIGRHYFTLKDHRRHPPRFSERNRFGYRRLLAIGEHWEIGRHSR